MKARLTQWLVVGIAILWLKEATAMNGTFRVIPAQTIHQQVASLFAHHYRDTGIRYQIEWLTPLSSWRVEPQVDSIAITPPPNHRWRGNLTVSLIAFSQGQVLRRRTLSLRVRTFQPVVITQQAITRGQFIPQSALQITTRETTFFRGTPLHMIPDDTLYARRNLSPGTILTQEDIRTSLLVRRGEWTTLIYQTSQLKIAVKAQALTDAGAGETIWFIRPENRKRLRATVIAPHRAVIQSQNRGIIP